MIAVGQVRLASFVSVFMVCVFPVAALFLLWPLGLDGLWLNALVTYVFCDLLCAGVLLRFRRTVHERLDRA
jgi:Na+-driven multidrug efflux pump